MPLELGGRRYFLQQEVAEIVGVHRHTIRRWANENKIPGGRKYPKEKARVFTEDEVEQIRLYAHRMRPAIESDLNQTELFAETI